MSDYLVSVSLDGSAKIAAPGTVAGVTPKGAVFSVVDCPPYVAAGDVLALASAFLPPPGVERIPYEKLSRVRNGGCCGGGCG